MQKEREQWMTSGERALMVTVGRVGARSWGVCVETGGEEESAGEGGLLLELGWGREVSCAGRGQDGRDRVHSRPGNWRQFLFPEV